MQTKSQPKREEEDWDIARALSLSTWKKIGPRLSEAGADLADLTHDAYILARECKVDEAKHRKNYVRLMLLNYIVKHYFGSKSRKWGQKQFFVEIGEANLPCGDSSIEYISFFKLRMKRAIDALVGLGVDRNGARIKALEAVHDMSSTGYDKTFRLTTNTQMYFEMNRLIKHVIEGGDPHEFEVDRRAKIREVKNVV